MMELLKFFFDDFTHFIGLIVLIVVIGTAIGVMRGV